MLIIITIIIIIVIIIIIIIINPLTARVVGSPQMISQPSEECKEPFELLKESLKSFLR